MHPNYKRKRNREILLNYEAGKEIKDLMRIHQISKSRVWQIINKEKIRLEEEGNGWSSFFDGIEVL